MTLLLLLPTAGLQVRLFILQHDCGHGSFFQAKWANDLVGRMLTIFTLTPYQQWRKHHAVHHATSGDLDRRGYGDIHMLTVREYNERTPWRKLVYRVYRHPLVIFGIAPLFYFGVYQRLPLEPRSWKKERWSIFWTNIVMAVALVAMWWFVGFTGLLLVHLPVSFIASSVGVWLFYVQHQFAPSYWQRNGNWDYFNAGIEGSSYYHLPKVLQWFTANIGLHHIHHVDSRIPNYRLQECFDENPQFQRVHHLTLWQSLSCASLKLWDEDLGEMVGFPKE
jgi:omega-6 fatty acid desaturase (delta-12 desaturase)